LEKTPSLDAHSDAGSADLPSLSFSTSGFRAGMRCLPEEQPIALTYNGSSYAVMMATPKDLEDFAIGFSLTEQIIATPRELVSLEIVPAEGSGAEVRMWVSEECGAKLSARRRRLAGPVGCGLCGIEAIAEAVRDPLTLPLGNFTVSSTDVLAALAALEGGQRLNDSTRAVHGAALWDLDRGLIALREDVGRHNALDKLVGAVARDGTGTSRSIAVVTSRVSIDLVQKAARLGAPVLVAISAPTVLAVDAAARCGLTLIGIARDLCFEVFSHSQRLASIPGEHRRITGG